MADLFKDILPAIMLTKKNVLDNEKDYVPFIVNKALSFHYDCVLYSNQMNILPHIDKKLQFDYCINTIRAYKRPYQKWLKKEQSDDIQAIIDNYQVSESKAREISSVLTNGQIDDIKKQQEKGGLKK